MYPVFLVGEDIFEEVKLWVLLGSKIGMAPMG